MQPVTITTSTRALVNGASSQIPKHGMTAWPQQQNENYVQYVFYLLFVRTHTKFGKKLFEIDMETVITVIHDLLTSPQGYQFDPRMRSLLVIPVDLICHMTMFEKLIHLGTPAPKSPTQGAWPRWHNENPVWFSIVRTHTKFGIKIFEIDILTIFDLLTSPMIISLTLGWKFYLHIVLLVIPDDLMCHITMFGKSKLPLGHPQRPKVPPLGHDQGDRMKIPFIS